MPIIKFKYGGTSRWRSQTAVGLRIEEALTGFRLQTPAVAGNLALQLPQEIITDKYYYLKDLDYFPKLQIVCGLYADWYG